jgi:broad specificity phosphatase PhoE
MTRVVLIRHGETEWNRDRRCQGQIDIPLNGTGQAQVSALADSLRGQGFEAIYSSDLTRARQTAEAVAEATRAPLLLDPRLREIHLGEWQGMLLETVRSTDPAYGGSFLHDPQAAPGKRRDRRRSLSAGERALDEILRRHPHGRVAIVSHGLALAAIKTRILGLALETVWQHEPENSAAEEFEMEAK